MTTLRWSAGHDSPRSKGVALAIHGLNYHPERMQPVVDCLNAAGVDCLSLSLHGHGDNYVPQPGLHTDAARLESFRRVTFELWRDEAAAACAIARTRADELGVPLLLTAYSMGALIGCTLIATRPEVRFERMILFAPAFALPQHGPLPWMARYAKRSVLPSISPIQYRANSGTPGAAYAAAYTALAAFRHGDLQRYNSPALIIIDKKDEVVPFAGVARIAEQLPAWTILPVQKSGPATGLIFHHLVMGKLAVGEDAWNDISARITAFLESPEQ